jgi:beta-glucuronidase
MDGKTGILDDPLGQYVDVIGSNEYIGWYQGKPEDAPLYTWQNPYNKPLIMSEWGGEGKSGLHGEITARFTEEMQAEIYKQQLTMLSKIPFLAGTTPWLLMDFRSPVRLLLQPQRRDLEQGDQEESVLCVAGLLREDAAIGASLTLVFS